MARFRIDQGDTGPVGQSRHDLVEGQEITLEVVDPLPGATYYWELIDHVGAPGATLTATGTTATIGPAGEITSPCTFLIRLYGDGQTEERVASVRAESGVRYPAYGEKAPTDATLGNHDPDDSTDNAWYPDLAGHGPGQNWAGWREWAREMVDAVDAASNQESDRLESDSGDAFVVASDELEFTEGPGAMLGWSGEILGTQMFAAAIAGRTEDNHPYVGLIAGDPESENNSSSLLVLPHGIFTREGELATQLYVDERAGHTITGVSIDWTDPEEPVPVFTDYPKRSKLIITTDTFEADVQDLEEIDATLILLPSSGGGGTPGHVICNVTEDDPPIEPVPQRKNLVFFSDTDEVVVQDFEELDATVVNFLGGAKNLRSIYEQPPEDPNENTYAQALVTASYLDGESITNFHVSLYDHNGEGSVINFDRNPLGERFELRLGYNPGDLVFEVNDHTSYGDKEFRLRNAPTLIETPIKPEHAATKAYVDSRPGAEEWSEHPATQDVDLDGHKITGLGEPTEEDDAATKGYVDAVSPAKIERSFAWGRAVAEVTDDGHIDLSIYLTGQTEPLRRVRVYRGDVASGAISIMSRSGMVPTAWVGLLEVAGGTAPGFRYELSGGAVEQNRGGISFNSGRWSFAERGGSYVVLGSEGYYALPSGVGSIKHGIHLAKEAYDTLAEMPAPPDLEWWDPVWTPVANVDSVSNVECSYTRTYRAAGGSLVTLEGTITVESLAAGKCAATAPVPVPVAGDPTVMGVASVLGPGGTALCDAQLVGDGSILAFGFAAEGDDVHTIAFRLSYRAA